MVNWHSIAVYDSHSNLLNGHDDIAWMSGCHWLTGGQLFTQIFTCR